MLLFVGRQLTGNTATTSGCKTHTCYWCESAQTRDHKSSWRKSFVTIAPTVKVLFQLQSYEVRRSFLVYLWIMCVCAVEGGDANPQLGMKIRAVNNTCDQYDRNSRRFIQFSSQHLHLTLNIHFFFTILQLPVLTPARLTSPTMWANIPHTSYSPFHPHTHPQYPPFLKYLP